MSVKRNVPVFDKDGDVVYYATEEEIYGNVRHAKETFIVSLSVLNDFAACEIDQIISDAKGALRSAELALADSLEELSKYLHTAPNMEGVDVDNVKKLNTEIRDFSQAKLYLQKYLEGLEEVKKSY